MTDQESGECREKNTHVFPPPHIKITLHHFVWFERLLLVLCLSVCVRIPLA